MARSRLLFALFLIGFGLVLGGWALIDSYQSRAAPIQAVSARTDAGGGTYLVRLRPRQRFIAAEAEASAKAMPKPRPQVVAVKETKPDTKPKADAKPKAKRPQQQTALQWPWNMFGN